MLENFKNETLNSEKKILNIIRFGAIIPILIFSCIITYILIDKKNEELKNEIDSIKSEYLERNKTNVKKEVDRVFDSINYEINKSEESLKFLLKEKVYEAHSIATNIHKEESDFIKNGHTHSTDHIFETIKNALGGMIYNNGRGYIFIDDRNGVNLLQPLNKDIEGKNLLEYTDAKGYQYMKKIADTVINKTEAYDEYYWYKSKDDKNTYKKLSFFKYFEPLDFAIGTGEYFDDFQKQIQENLLDKINNIKFEDNGYIFIFNTEGTYLSHFDKNKIGTNGLNLKDVNGKYFIKDMIEFAKNNNEGYFTYLASLKPNGSIHNTEKISYVKYFKEWDWVIGAGFYLEELNQIIQNKKIELKDKHKTVINNILALSGIITIILAFISFFISKIIEKMFNDYRRNIKKEIDNTLEKERLLIQQSKMAVMGEMIGNIAHQWKQPLSTISTISTGIKFQNEMNCLNDHDITLGMDNINGSVQYLSQTIDDFRNFFKPNKTKTNFNILDALENTIKLMGSQFKNNNIELIKNINNAELYGYYNELLQVLINILKNAKDELIKLDTNKRRIIFIDTYTDKSNLIIKIRDNANGIPSDIIEKIFDPYFTTKENDEGTGIGLYMCKQIIDGMTGKIQVINVEYEYEAQRYYGAEFIISMEKFSI
jgi:two-component system NtrC family sensor kinase